MHRGLVHKYVMVCFGSESMIVLGTEARCIHISCICLHNQIKQYFCTKPRCINQSWCCFGQSFMIDLALSFGSINLEQQHQQRILRHSDWLRLFLLIYFNYYVHRSKLKFSKYSINEVVNMRKVLTRPQDVNWRQFFRFKVFGTRSRAKAYRHRFVPFSLNPRLFSLKDRTTFTRQSESRLPRLTRRWCQGNPQLAIFFQLPGS